MRVLARGGGISSGGGWLTARGLDARGCLLAMVVFVVAVVATPIGAWKLFAVEGLVLAFVLGVSGLEVGPLFRRWLGLLMLVSFLALMIGFGHPRRADLGLAGVAASIMARNALALQAVLLLGALVPFHRLLQAMARLRTPPVLVATLHFMYRYLHVLGEERDRMLKARRSRSFGRRGWLDWSILSNLLGLLFVRSMERGERVHSAMLARGWDGTLRSLDGSDAG